VCVCACALVRNWRSVTISRSWRWSWTRWRTTWHLRTADCGRIRGSWKKVCGTTQTRAKFCWRRSSVPFAGSVNGRWRKQLLRVTITFLSPESFILSYYNNTVKRCWYVPMKLGACWKWFGQERIDGLDVFSGTTTYSMT